MSLNKYQTVPQKKKKALFPDIVHKNIQSKFRRGTYERELIKSLWSNLNNLIGVSFHEALTVFPSVSSFLLLSR